MTLHRHRISLSDLLFLLPSAVIFVVFVLLPFLQGIPYSFFKWDGFSANRSFVAFHHYARVFRDRAVFESLGNTLEFTVLHTLFANLVGLGFAVLVRRTTRVNKVTRVILFMPFVLSLVLSAIMWTYIYSNVIYRYFSIPTPLGNVHSVMGGLAWIAIWRDAGYCMVVYLAALQGVPAMYYEAARIEGAGPAAQFFRVTVPLIVPAFTANVTLLLSWGLKMFDYSMVATGGGPGRASETLAMLVYRNIFQFYKAGYGQALAVVMTVAIFLVSATTARALREREVEL